MAISTTKGNINQVPPNYCFFEVNLDWKGVGCCKGLSRQAMGPCRGFPNLCAWPNQNLDTCQTFWAFQRRYGQHKNPSSPSAELTYFLSIASVLRPRHGWVRRFWMATDAETRLRNATTAALSEHRKDKTRQDNVWWEGGGKWYPGLLDEHWVLAQVNAPTDLEYKYLYTYTWKIYPVKGKRLWHPCAPMHLFCQLILKTRFFLNRAEVLSFKSFSRSIVPAFHHAFFYTNYFSKLKNFFKTGFPTLFCERGISPKSCVIFRIFFSSFPPSAAQFFLSPIRQIRFFS